MQIEQFAAMTQRIISSQGFEGFQPTACFPERRDIVALAGVPEDEAHEAIALQWAAGLASEGEEYLVVFKHSPSQFKVIRVYQNSTESQVHAVDV